MIYLLILLFTSCNCQESSSCGTGDIRLLGGSTVYEGRVEVCLNNEWGTVCDDGFPSHVTVQTNAATVICRQLGLSSVNAVVTYAITNPNTEEAFGEALSSVPIHLDQVSCLGNERGLIDCSHDGLGVDNCFRFEDVGIFCSPGCIEGSARLVQGGSPNSGHVELCRNQSWTTVIIGPTEASVFCRQIGLWHEGALVVSNGSYGAGFGSIFSYNCQGNESSLFDCNSTEHGNYNHDNDSGVVCKCCLYECNPDPAREVCRPTIETTTQGGCNIEATSTTLNPEVFTDVPCTTRIEEILNEETTNEVMVDTQAQVLSVGNCGLNSALGALVGILVIALVAAIIGWIVSVIVLKRRMQLFYEPKQNLSAINVAHLSSLPRQSGKPATSEEDQVLRVYQNSLYEDADMYATIEPEACRKKEEKDITDNTSEDDDMILNDSYNAVHVQYPIATDQLYNDTHTTKETDQPTSTIYYSLMGEDDSRARSASTVSNKQLLDEVNNPMYESIAIERSTEVNLPKNITKDN